ncbi:MAG: tetratricopeptide repeat protein, partial [Desulfobacteraceae bacterium]
MEFSAHVRPYSGDIERLQHNAQYFKMIGKPELAIKELEGAHYRYPGDLKLINTLARTYDELGEFDRAQELYQEGLAQQSNNPAMINNLGFSYYLSGKFQEAENCFREVLGQNPNNQSAQNNLGLLLCRQNRQDEALQLWEEKDGQMAAQEKMKEVLALLGMPAPDIYAQKSSSHTSAPSKLEPGLSISKSEKIAARQLLNPAGQEPVRHGTAPKAAVAATPISPTEIMASKPGQSEMADQKLSQLPASTPELEKEIISSAD